MNRLNVLLLMSYYMMLVPKCSQILAFRCNLHLSLPTHAPTSNVEKPSVVSAYGIVQTGYKVCQIHVKKYVNLTNVVAQSSKYGMFRISRHNVCQIYTLFDIDFTHIVACLLAPFHGQLWPRLFPSPDVVTSTKSVNKSQTNNSL